MALVNQIFVNLPVADLNRSVEFFTKIGFTFNPQFTNDDATCMVLNDTIYAMLLVPKFFKGFIDKEIADAKTTTSTILALSVNSRDEVNEFTDKALAAGGRQYKDAQEYPFMFSRNFEDLDGHMWEFFYMDMSAMPQE
ncbi:glyoxalase/bleomycin resistance/extradiol dioxygenase family protein [Flavobacterium zepuense]|uniref:Glyoxalase/bleomycin resistance/extradiol dioxygenase family protein n=1 Tax=Flavobacterium zepuense TaxID=2593302 RepID=A0A552V0C4_9FLAO|nr:VOC family protein [Flavobacterium zepuense]TRW23926.1 glyoxalase/bleomycin resistance/extradiol dioxygenase family protein [Flavobacterium zepuense]